MENNEKIFKENLVGYWVSDHKTGVLYYQVNRRVRLTWQLFNMEHLQELMKQKQISNLDFLEAILDLYL